VLWRTPQAMAAFEKFRSRMAQGIPIEAVNEDDLSDHLAMVNIESVYCAFAPNLKDFFEAADKHVTEKYVKNIAEWMKDSEREPDPTRTGDSAYKVKAPDGSGWIFAIHGYTYFDTRSENKIDYNEFIRRSIVRNLQIADYYIDKNLGSDTVVREFLPGVNDPVKGKISHVFPFLIRPSRTNSPGTFDFISSDHLNPLIAGSSPGARQAASGEENHGPTPGKNAAQAGAWVPLLHRAAATNEVRPPGSPPPPAPGTLPASPLSTKTRYEFVVMFVWREPTPSGGGAAAPSSSTDDSASPQKADMP
jgi:type IV pilus assembly protein PilM